jgi:hypothetical protein
MVSMKKIIVASLALLSLTGCWWPPAKWDEGGAHASCKQKFPGDSAAAKKCYDDAYLSFEREEANRTNTNINR